jgi:SAM-dependent methyltransferase
VSLSRCRFCDSPLSATFLDLGATPLSNAYLTRDALTKMEPFYPLHALVCEKCFLVQIEEYESPAGIFTDYAYFSSYSDSWLAHCRLYVEMVRTRFALKSSSLVIELASNDGCLLQYFRDGGIPVLGVEPATNVAEFARGRGIQTIDRFFGTALADELVREGRQADLLLGNNVLAHVPALNDFVAGMKRLLKPLGVITMEFPHLLRLVAGKQFDTIYHEHFSYFSLLTAQQVFARHGLTLFDVDELPTHGGSLRIYVRHDECTSYEVTGRVADLLSREKAAGMDRIEYYRGFSSHIEQIRWRLLKFLIDARERGQVVAGYGAPAKGNTLLNYCGVRTDLLGFTVDRNPHKQNRFLPGTRIPVFHPDHLDKVRPDFVLILPWNIRDEIVGQIGAKVRSWHGRFVVPLPSLEVFD